MEHRLEVYHSTVSHQSRENSFLKILGSASLSSVPDTLCPICKENKHFIIYKRIWIVNIEDQKENLMIGLIIDFFIDLSNGSMFWDTW